ncbi:MAG: histidine kinase [Bacteroidales bacterium]|nr:histidine kinase [Bacteroidales bacterium]
MSIYKRQTKQETVIYTIVWIILFMVPVVELIFNYDPENPVWLKHGLLETFGTLLLFLVVFLIHNHILAPMLIHHKKVYQYIACCVVMVALFQTVQCIHHPHGPTPPEMAGKTSNSPGPPSKPMFKPPYGRPPVNWHDLSMFTIVIMMIGANLGVKIYFLSEEEKKRLAKLKEQSLKQELDYLRYQINPHFIMNTLNNIHALVDIDPEQAKDSIVDMSRMMRYLLYESDNQYVTFNTAMNFLKKYLNLMKLRFTDKVTVNLDIPEMEHEDVALAPLVFIPFVENAFKHGVAYDKPSIIDIDIEKKDGRLLFHCRNTKGGARHEYGGVGLNNVTKRLELIYGSDYSLDIHDGENDYDVLLNLPARRAIDFKQSDHDPQQ